MNCPTRGILGHLDVLKCNLKGKNYSPALLERLHILENVLHGFGSNSILRSIGAPVVVSDLGVRKVDHLREFYISHCSLAGIPPIESAVLTDYCLNATLDDLAHVIDALVCFFGDYEAVFDSILVRSDEIISSRKYDLLIYSGVVCAALGDDGFMKLFEAAENCASSNADAYLATHRYAAALAKRMGRFSDAKNYLMSKSSTYLCDADKELQALYYNLVALFELKISEDGAAIRSKDFVCRAEHFINEAWKDDIPSCQLSRIGRYLSQISINKAQIDIFSGDYEFALKTLFNAEKIVGEISPEYVCELYATVGYIYYRQLNIGKSLHYLKLACVMYRFIGDLTGIEAVRKVIVSCLVKNDAIEEAEKCFALISEDRLGLTMVDGINV